MNKFYIKETDSYVKMTTEEKRLWDNRKEVSGGKNIYLSYSGWSNESGALLINLVEKLNGEKPAKIFCTKKMKEWLFGNKNKFYNRKIISNNTIINAYISLFGYICYLSDSSLLIISTETGSMFGVFEL